MVDQPSPLWQCRWFQWLLVVLLALLAASFVVPPILTLIYAARSVLLPVLVALGLAYIFNPPVTWAQWRLRLPRWAGTASVMVLGLLAAIVLMLAVVPPAVSQGADLILKLKEVYPDLLVDLLGEPSSTSDAGATTSSDRPQTSLNDSGASSPTESASQDRSLWDRASQWLPDAQHRRELLHKLADRLRDMEWSHIRDIVLNSLDVGVGMAKSAISLTSYAVVAAVVSGFCFFFFSWKFDLLTGWFVPFIPTAHRPRTLEILDKMDASVAAFIRGRLIQSLVIAMILSLGWRIFDVPYWLLLGVFAGLLNLVPYAAIVAWLAATILALVDHLAGGGTISIMVLVWPTVVYVVAQLVDSWAVEPLVQGKATDLDPLTVLLVVLIGASLAGLLGMIVAIPLAACIKILAREVLLPKLRELAAAGADQGRGTGA